MNAWEKRARDAEALVASLRDALEATRRFSHAFENEIGWEEAAPGWACITPADSDKLDRLSAELAAALARTEGRVAEVQGDNARVAAGRAAGASSEIGTDALCSPGAPDSKLAEAEARVVALQTQLDAYERALRKIEYLGGDDLSPDECVRTLALARGLAARMLGATTIGGSLAADVEALVLAVRDEPAARLYEPAQFFDTRGKEPA